ncbi:hypothetical protein MNV49_005975 [Pseudohyphozyma bogoriensis]|nr:hypothetical protein MNV49_005975 [Pseudohyphozyma bogoriensis]
MKFFASSLALAASIVLAATPGAEAHANPDLFGVLGSLVNGVGSSVGDVASTVGLSTTTTGIIQVSGQTNGYIGYNPINPLGKLAYTITDLSHATKFTVPAASCLTLPSVFNVVGNFSTDFPSYQNLGVTGYKHKLCTGDACYNQVGTRDIAAGTYGFGYVTPSNQTAAKTYATGASSLSSADQGSESAIWSMDCSTKHLTATWTAVDGTSVPLTFVDYFAGFMEATGNFNKYLTVAPRVGTPLTFTFVTLGAF